ncbi:MAG: hypothetical protein IKB80_02205 [Oscillospiraceae bacterium]|nr:hypothetical protein [Oscillospiraceae bacterium]
MANDCVKTYLFASTNVDDLTTKQLLVKLFTEQPLEHYETQEEIAVAVYANYGVKRSQSAVAKGLGKIINKPFLFKGVCYIVSKTEGYYRIQKKDEHNEELREQMVRGNLFKREYAYYEHDMKAPQTFVFWIADSAKAHAEAKESFEKILAGEYVDIFYIDDKLVIMLDHKSQRRKVICDMLKNFFVLSYNAYKHI